MKGVDRETAAIATPEFWAEVLDGGAPIEVWVRGEEKFSLDAKALRAEFGAVVPERWAAEDRRQHQKQLDELREQHKWFRSADFYNLVSPIRPLAHRGAAVDFAALIQVELPDPLLRDLVSEGHIDRNFPLYSSEFHGVVATANAMTFVTQHVNAEFPAHSFELSADEVAMVIREADRGVFESVGLYNTSIYDRLLETSDTRLDANISLLASGRPIDLEFIAQYVAEGRYPDRLVRRLSQYWDRVFDLVAEVEEGDDRTRLAIAAFDGGDPSREYVISDEMRATIAGNYRSIGGLTIEGRSPDRAVRLLQRLGVRLPSLKALSPTARDAVAIARTYVVTRENLRAVLGNDAVQLDSILSADENAFHHAVFHTDEYLKALAETKPPAESISGVDSIVPIVAAMERHAAGSALPVLKCAAKGLAVADLTEVPSNVMGVLAEGNRFAVTAHNVELYLDSRAMDAELIPVLEAAKRIQTPADFDAGSRIKIATQIVNEIQLSVDGRVSLVGSLLEAPLEMRRISSREPELIRKLVIAGLVEDNATSFDLLSGSAESQEAFIAGSPLFANYFDQITRTDSTMTFLANSAALSDELKNRMLVELPNVPQFATASVVNGLVEWAISSSFSIPESTLKTVLTSPASVENKVRVAVQAAGTHSRAQVEDFLRQIGEPYSRLTARGERSVTLPPEPDPTALLTVLRDDPASAVSSWDVAKEQVVVWLRKPIE